MISENLPPEAEQILQLVFQHAGNGDFDQALIECEKIQKFDASTADTIAGLIHFKKGDYANAVLSMEKGVQVDAEPEDLLHLALAATMNQEIEKGKVQFEKSIALSIQKNGNEHGLIGYLLNYVDFLEKAKAYDQAFLELDRLKTMYSSMGSMDPTYMVLTTGGDLSIPSLSSVLEIGEKLLRHMKPKKAKEWLEDFAAKLDEDGKNTIEQTMASMHF